MKAIGEHSRWRSIATRIVTALIVLVVTSAIVVEVKSSIAKTNQLVSSNYVARQNLQYAYFECLGHQVRSLVPPGEPVWVSLHAPQGGEDITLKEVVAPYAPIANRPAGVVELSLVEARRNTAGCLGIRVKAQAPDGAVRFGSGSLVGSLKDLPPNLR